MTRKIYKQYKWLKIGIILFLLLSAASTGQAQTESPVTVRVVPDQARVAVDGTVDIAVEVEDVSDLYGIDILLEFDPQVVEVVDMDPDLEGVQIQLGTFLDPGFVILNLVDNGIGRLRLAMTQLAPSEPRSGDGSLIVVRLLGKTESAPAAVTVISAKLANATGSLIEVGTIENGTVEVVETIVEPTNTPLPAVPPGTPMPTSTPVDTPTQGTEPTQEPGEPTATATDRFLFIPPTATATVPPTITPTATVTATKVPSFTPTGIVEHSATLEQEDSAQAGEDLSDDVESPAPDEEVAQESGGFNLWWLSIPGALILGGAAWYLFKKNGQDGEEPLM